MSTQRQRIAQQSNSFFRFAVPFSRWLVPTLCCVLLIGCADSDTERRFANDPTLTEEAAATATDPPFDVAPVTPTSSNASPVAIDDILRKSGGTSTVYFQVGDRLNAISAPWNEPRWVWSAENERLLGFEPSPSTDEVAVLIASSDDLETVKLLLLTARGDVVKQVKELGKNDFGPDGTSQDTIGRLTWSPDGSQLVVALPGTGLIAVPRDGEPVLLVESTRFDAAGLVTWSPTGHAIAFVSPTTPGQSGALYVATTGTLPLDPIAIVPVSGNNRRTIDRVAWRPDGEALFYTVASTTDDPTFGGDLFSVPATGGSPLLIAGASRVGPVSAITNFALSPDGAGVAFVVTVPRDDGGFTDSLWLQPVGSRDVLSLPIPASERVMSLWWTTDGLLWQSFATDDPDPTSVTFSLARPTGEAGVVYVGPPAVTKDATPVGESSPEAESSSQAGTPVSSPVASPQVIG